MWNFILSAFVSIWLTCPLRTSSSSVRHCSVVLQCKLYNSWCSQNTLLIGLIDLVATTLQQILSWFILFSLPPSPSQLQTPSTIADWLSGSDPLPIDFVLDQRLWISCFPRLRFYGRCRNLEFTITITMCNWKHRQNQQRILPCMEY